MGFVHSVFAVRVMYSLYESVSIRSPTRSLALPDCLHKEMSLTVF